MALSRPTALRNSPRHAARVAAYYDANTQPFYLDRWHPHDIHFGLFDSAGSGNDHHSAVKRMTEYLIAPAAIQPGQRVLDAGCGVGGAALDVARTTGANVLGVTISPVQVEIASRRVRDAGLCGLARFEVADCSVRLPCDDHSIDVVLTIEAACHFEDKANFLRECRRVLRPGGQLVGSDWMAVDGLHVAAYDKFLQPVSDAWRLSGMETPCAWRAMLLEAGFRNEQTTDLGPGVVANAKILARAALDLRLELANGCHSQETAHLWLSQYDSLVRAWFEGAFTIGQLSANSA